MNSNSFLRFLPSQAALIKSPIFRAMESGTLARFEEITRCASEVQDAMIPLEQLTGPANDLARAPTSTKVFHRLSLRFGLDVVLEQKRGRRY